jgi:hypothetical protein
MPTSYGYGEDALTIWALQKQLSIIMEQLDDTTPVEPIKVFLRPSFGRKGGASRAEFGEFGFILSTDTMIYLGETKLQGSPETARAQTSAAP